MVIISALTFIWMMAGTEHLWHFVYSCKSNGLVVRLVCVGKCGDGLEGDLFTCGGCGWKTAQDVDDRTAPRSVSCGGSGAVWALRRIGEELLLTHAHTTCGGRLGVDCVNLKMIHMNIKVCAEPCHAPSVNLPMVFLWAHNTLQVHINSYLPHIHYPELLWEWDLCHVAPCMWIITFSFCPMPMTGYWRLLCASFTVLKHQLLSIRTYIYQRQDFYPPIIYLYPWIDYWVGTPVK